jgi:hypothetical protein
MDRLDGLTDRVLRELEACGMMVSSSADSLNGASFCCSSAWLFVVIIVVGLELLFVSLPSTEQQQLFTEPGLGVLEAKVAVLIDEQESFPKSGP